MDGHFRKWKLELEVADCTPGIGFSLKQKTASSCNCFRFPSPIRMHLCVHARQLAAPSSFPKESPVWGTGQGLHGDKFPRVGKNGVGMKSKGKGIQ